LKQQQWIVSNITRATNDRTAKNMLSESFRRQLLMDGQFGSLVFVATQSDAFQRSELCRNLGLPRTTSALDAAKARNEFTKQRVRDDFYAGLIEVPSCSNHHPSRSSIFRATVETTMLPINNFGAEALAQLLIHTQLFLCARTRWQSRLAKLSPTGHKWSSGSSFPW
jgi:hypothetical protein